MEYNKGKINKEVSNKMPSISTPTPSTSTPLKGNGDLVPNFPKMEKILFSIEEHKQRSRDNFVEMNKIINNIRSKIILFTPMSETSQGEISATETPNFRNITEKIMFSVDEMDELEMINYREVIQKLYEIDESLFDFVGDGEERE